MRKISLLMLACMINSSMWAMHKKLKEQRIVISEEVADLIAPMVREQERRSNEFYGVVGKKNESIDPIRDEAQRRAKFIVDQLKNKLMTGSYKKGRPGWAQIETHFGMHQMHHLKEIYSGKNDAEVQMCARKLVFEQLQKEGWGDEPIASEDSANQESNK